MKTNSVTKSVQFTFGLACLIGLMSGNLAGAQSTNAGDYQKALAESVAVVGDKVIALAEAFSDDQYLWRPGEGVRSSAETFLHIAGTNFWMPTMLGISAPAGSEITGEYASVVEFEKKSGKAQIVRALRDSFAHMKQSIEGIPNGDLNNEMNVFGNPSTVRAYLLLLSTHMHEHMGQLVAYARVQGVVPPWSN